MPSPILILEALALGHALAIAHAADDAEPRIADAVGEAERGAGVEVPVLRDLRVDAGEQLDREVRAGDARADLFLGEQLDVPGDAIGERERRPTVRA